MHTSDVYLASALLALGYKLDSVDRKDPRHMTFGFVPPALTGSLSELMLKNILEVETAWANKTLTVNAFEFAEAIKRMKSLIHSS